MLKVIKKVEQENGNTVLTLVGIDPTVSGQLCLEVAEGTEYSIGDSLNGEILAQRTNVREELEMIKEVIDIILMGGL